MNEDDVAAIKHMTAIEFAFNEFLETHNVELDGKAREQFFTFYASGYIKGYSRCGEELDANLAATLMY